MLRIERARLKGGRGAFRRRVRSRTVPLHPVVVQAIREYLVERAQAGPLDPAAPLFQSTQRGKPISAMQAWRIFRRIYARIGLTAPGAATHVTRRTAARNMYSNTKDIELVRAALGHTSVVTSQIYIRASEADAATALLAL